MSALPDDSRTDLASIAASSELLADMVSRHGEGVSAAVVLALSRFVGEHRDRDFNDIYNLKLMLLRYVTVRLSPAEQAIQAKLGTLRTPSSLMRAMGLTRGDLNEQWNAAVARDGRWATLRPDVFDALFPAPVRDAACVLVADGPGAAAESLERVLRLRANEDARVTRARPDPGRISRGTLKMNLRPVRGFMNNVIDLNRRDVLEGSLRQWQGMPRITLPPAAAANTDGSAPSRRQVRLARAGPDKEMKRRLRASTNAQEALRIQTMGPAALKAAGVWELSKRRLVIDLIFGTGARPGAVADLKRADVHRAHEGPDGRLGPAIALRPGKNHPPDEVHWKPIPEWLLHSIEVYLMVTDRLITESPKDAGRSARPAPGPGDPLLIGRLSQPGKHTSTAALSQMMKRLLPKANGGGFSCTPVRHATNQAVKEGVSFDLGERGQAVTAEMLAEALLDHDMPEDRYGYQDVNNLRGREKFSGKAIEYAGEMLLGDLGARKAVDYERVGEIRRSLALLREEQQREERRISSISTTPSQDQTTKLIVAIRREGKRLVEIHDLERELDAVLNDPAKLVPVPDDVPDEELMSRRAPRVEVVGEAPPQVLRDWVIVPEFPIVYELSRAQSRRWANGTNLPHKPGDPRRAFEPDAIPVDLSQGPRKRRFWVGGLSPGSFPSESAREALRQLLMQWPAGWPHQQYDLPLHLPEPFATLRGDDPEPQLGWLA